MSESLSTEDVHGILPEPPPPFDSDSDNDGSPSIGPMADDGTAITSPLAVPQGDVFGGVTPEQLFTSGRARRIWYPPTTSHFYSESFRLEVAARFIPLLRSDIDYIILPAEVKVREFFDFCSDALGFRDSQVIWINARRSSDTDGSDNDLCDRLRDIVVTATAAAMDSAKSSAGSGNEESTAAKELVGDVVPDQQTAPAVEHPGLLVPPEAGELSSPSATLLSSNSASTSPSNSPVSPVAAAPTAAPTPSSGGGRRNIRRVREIPPPSSELPNFRDATRLSDPSSRLDADDSEIRPRRKSDSLNELDLEKRLVRFIIVAYTVDDTISECAQALGVPLLGHNLQHILRGRVKHLGTHLLHSSANRPEKRSFIRKILENNNYPVKLPKGYRCSNVNQLLLAFRNLAKPTALIRPMFKSNGEGSIVIRSIEELRLYDFPYGAVILEEVIEYDQSPSGLAINPVLNFIGKAITGPVMDTLLMHHTFMGLQQTVTLQEFQEKIIATSRVILKKSNDVSYGTLEFQSVNGEPYLVSITSRKFLCASVVRLFVETHGRNAPWICFRNTPHASLDPWTFWLRAQDEGIAFNVGNHHGVPRGVFPLIFLRGLTGTFLAFADTPEELDRLRTQTEEIVREPVTIRDLKFSSWTKSRHYTRIWCQSPPSGFGIEQFRLSFPAQSVLMVRSGYPDYCVLPDVKPVRDWFEFSAAHLGLKDEQALWTKGVNFSMDADIDSEVVNKIKTIALGISQVSQSATVSTPASDVDAQKNNPIGCTIVPVAYTDSFRQWSSQLHALGVRYHAERLKWTSKFGSRLLLYRDIDRLDQPTIAETLESPIAATLPNGFICRTQQSLLNAFARLQTSQVVIKPISASVECQEMSVINDAQQLNLFPVPSSGVVMEAPRSYDSGPDGSVLTFALVCIGGRLLHTRPVELILSGNTLLGFRPLVVADSNKESVNKCVEYSKLLLERIKARCFGVIEFSFIGGSPVVSDFFLGYMSIIHSALRFEDEFGRPDRLWMVRRCIPSNHAHVRKYHRILVEKNSWFTPGKSTRGIFPLLFLPGHTSFSMMFSKDVEDLQYLRSVADEAARYSPPPRHAIYESSVFHSRYITKNQFSCVWFQSPLISDRTTCDALRYECPVRPACLLRPGKDIIVLPGDNAPTTEFWNFCKTMFAYDEDQVVWTSGKSFLLDADLLQHPQALKTFIDRIAQLVLSSESHNVLIVPNAASDFFHQLLHIVQEKLALLCYSGPSPRKRGSVIGDHTNISFPHVTAADHHSRPSGVPDTTRSTVIPLLDADRKIVVPGDQQQPARSVSSASLSLSARSRDDGTEETLDKSLPDGQSTSLNKPVSARRSANASSASVSVAPVLSVVAEQRHWLDRFGSISILFRRISSPDSPCLLEQVLGKEIIENALPRGYLCSTVPDLLTAFDLLKSPRCILVSISRSCVDAAIPVTGPEQLRLYDFPAGDVVLAEEMEPDRAKDGLAILPSVDFLRDQIVGSILMDRIVVGHDNLGVRRSHCSEALEEQLVAIARHFLQHVSPHAAGCIDFVSVRGQPKISNFHVGSFSDFHFPKLFQEQQELDDAEMFVWRYCPPQSLDIWTYWNRLIERKAAFMPGQSKSGVFPMIYLRGIAGLFVVFAKDAAELSALRAHAEEALRDPLPPLAAIEMTSFNNEHLRRIWVQSTRPEYKRLSQRVNLAFRSLGLIRPGMDIVILPGEFPNGREFFEFMRQIMGLSEDQVLWTPGKCLCMDDEIDDDIVTRLKQIVTTSKCGPQGFVLIPYAVTPNFQRWASALESLGVNLVGERPEWIEKFGHKGILHRRVDKLDEPSVIETVGAGRLTVPRGYTCSTVDDLIKAYRLLDCIDVVLKPVFGAAGEGILFINSEEQLRIYDFPMGDVALEERLNLDRASDGVVLSPAVHYMENQLFGDDLVDQIMIGTGYAGWRMSRVTQRFKDAAFRMVKGIVARIKPTGPGGFDFLSQNGQPYLTDVNTGRFNGAHFPKMFFQIYGRGQAWICWKRMPPVELHVRTFWARLKTKGISFIPGKSSRGVFPYVYLRGRSGQYMAFGRDEVEVNNLKSQAEALMNSPVTEQEREALKHPMVDGSVSGSTAPETPTDFETTTFPLKLIVGGIVFAPEPLGKVNILVAGTKIVGILNESQTAAIRPMVSEVVDVHGNLVVPGLVDIHVHLTGGGGEMGPASRTPEALVSELVDGGMTTVVGVLGTDSFTRSPVNLLAKCRALNAEGLTAYMFTGAYQVPPPTISGSVTKDICLFDEVIGAGEIAISDHRGSQPSAEELSQLASDCRVGGLLAGKAGVMYCHIGDQPTCLQPLLDLVHHHQAPIHYILPTHCHRSAALVQQAILWIQAGGTVDFTSRAASTVKSIVDIFSAGLPLDHVITSSDSYGSLPQYDESGQLVRYRKADTQSLLKMIRRFVLTESWPLDRVLPLCTSTPAEFLKLKGKGRIRLDYDADLLVLDVSRLDLCYVMCGGRILKTPNWTHKGMFEY